MPTSDQSTVDQSTVDLQKKILHSVSNGTPLAWLIDIQRQQVWVWEKQELPMIYADSDRLPVLEGMSDLPVKLVMAMTKQR